MQTLQIANFEWRVDSLQIKRKISRIKTFTHISQRAAE